jgi:hypothetical protein
MTDGGLGDVILAAERDAPKNSWWRHRGGGHYQVVGHCVIEATREVGVLYYGRGGVTWCRPLSEFTDGRFARLPEMPTDWGAT